MKTKHNEADKIRLDKIREDKIKETPTEAGIKSPQGVQEFLKYFGELWSRQRGGGQPYPINFGKEGRIVKDLLRLYSFSDLSALALRYFDLEDEFTQKTGYTLGYFKVAIPKLISKKEDKYGNYAREAADDRARIAKILAGDKQPTTK